MRVPVFPESLPWEDYGLWASADGQRGFTTFQIEDPQQAADAEAKDWFDIWASHGDSSTGFLPRPWRGVSTTSP